MRAPPQRRAPSRAAVPLALAVVASAFLSLLLVALFVVFRHISDFDGERFVSQARLGSSSYSAGKDPISSTALKHLWPEEQHEHHAHDEPPRQEPVSSIFASASFSSIPPPLTSKHTIDDGWAGPALFHTMDDGQKIQGSLLASKKALVFDLDNATLWQVRGTCGQHICARLYRPGRCEWCSTSGRCILGTLFAGRSRDERGTTMNGFGAVLASQRSDSMKPDMATYFTIFFNCVLDSSNGGEAGRLRVQGMPGFSVAVLPAPRPVQTGEDIVCSRGLFGDMEAETVVKWTHHYIHVLGFSRALVYQIGMDRGVSDHPVIREYLAKGVLVFIDLRDELQRVYGALSSDVLMYSLCIGQIMLKQDCVVRSRSMGARWTLHVDVDELLFMGVDTTNAMTRWSDFIAPMANLTWISLGSHSVTGPVGRDPCACTALDWSSFIESERSLHREEEWKQPLEPFDCTSRHHRPSVCTGAYGMRKLAVRVDTPLAINPIGVSIHVVFECGFPDGCGDQVKAVGLDVDARVAYLRHYRCLNFALPQPCGRLKGAFWQSPEQIAIAEGHREPPRKVVHRSVQTSSSVFG